MSENNSLAEEMDALQDKYLIFHLGEQIFALEIRHVAEIIGMQKITPLPFEADFVKGVINLRGQVIPVMDARLRLGMEERPYDDRTCIIICKVKEMLIGLIVDSVNEVTTILPDQIEEPPRLRKNKRTNFLQGLAKKDDGVHLVIDVQNFLFAEELVAWQSTMAVNETN